MSSKKRTPHEDRIVHEAAIWVARLQSSDATDKDREDFAAWVGHDPAHAAMFNELLDLWKQLKDVPISSDRLAQLRKSRRGNLNNLAIIGFLASAVLFSAYHLGVFDRLRADYYTAVGEVRTFELADGSRAYLNTDTAIALKFSDKQREVTLLRGQAFFDVKPAVERPFVVVKGELAAEAVGTRYGVISAFGDRHPEVQVEEGKVRVSATDRQITVTAGEGVTLNPGGSLALTKVDENDLMWRSGKLVFSGRPLSEVLATLSRYRSGNILLMDRNIGLHKVSGVFNVSNTDQALDALEQTVPLNIRRLPGGVVLVWSR